jgi:hypothetical protein
MYIHGSSGAPLFFERATNITVDHCWIVGNASSGAGNHAEALADMNTQYITVSNSMFEDIVGSGYLVELDRGGCSGGACSANNWAIYGNIFMNTNGGIYKCTGGCDTGLGDGVIAVLNGLNANNWVIYQNDFVNLTNGVGGICLGCTGEGGGGSGNIVENNIWYSNPTGAGQSCTGGYTCTLDYNSYLKTTMSGDSGTHTITDSNSANPFAGWQSSPLNYHLANESADWISGVTLSSPYNTDPDGVTRGATGNWDRGVFQIGGKTSTQHVGVALIGGTVQ